MSLNKIKVNDTTTVNTGVVYDITKATGQSYDSLSAAIGTDGNNVPLEIREGGMTVRFVSNSDNKYVQYRLTKDEWSINIEDWDIAEEGVLVDNPEYVYVKIDAEGKALEGIQADGTKVIGGGLLVNSNAKVIGTTEIGVGLLVNGNAKVIGTTEISGALYKVIESPEWIRVLVDFEDKVLCGIKRNGKFYADIDGIDKIEEFVNKFAKIFKLFESPEYISVELDSDEKVLGGRDIEGYLIEHVGIKANKIVLSKQGLDELQSSLGSQGYNRMLSRWQDKSIVWFGTSIPSYTVENSGYPNICAELLGANIYNEAVGGSAARGYRPIGEDMDTSYWGRSYIDHKITMGQTIAEKLRMLYTIITIDDVNQTVAWAGNTLGMHNLPGGWSSSNVPSYATAIAERKQLMQYSYEIKLISKYLDKDGSIIRTILNSDDIKEITGLLSPYDYLYDEQTMGFKCSPDLFVFDHAFNDTLNAEIPDAEIGSMNRETFQGAMNTFHYYITVLASAKPICVVSDYHADGHPWWAYSATKKIAAYWEVPFIDVKALLPFGWRSVTLSGYWDGAYNSYFGKYHNEGFSFTYNTLAGTDWSTNNMMMEYAYRNSTRPSAQTVINRWNIRTDTITRKQVYDAAAIYQYSKDGLHPFSQRYSLEKYAEVLSSVFLTLSV